MTDAPDLTPAALNGWLLKLSREVGEAIAEVRDTAGAVAESDRAYKQAYAQAYLAADGAVKERESHADLRTLDERRALKLAEGLSRSADLALRARMAQLNALQSVSASVRQEFRFGQTGPDAGGAT